MRQYLGEPYGYFVTETGDLNQFVHMWRYDSMADREQRRAAMYRDPRAGTPTAPTPASAALSRTSTTAFCAADRHPAGECDFSPKGIPMRPVATAIDLD